MPAGEETLLAAGKGPAAYGSAGDPLKGLSSEEAKELLKEFGPNELDTGKKDSFLKILVTQMGNTIFLLTTIASTICFLNAQYVKAYFLISIVIVVCLLNAVGEYTGQDAGAALKAMTPPAAKVIRDGQETEVDVTDIVPGDIVRVGLGDVVAADMEVVTCLDLQTNEAVLTGEPNEVSKASEPNKEAKDEAFPRNMLYKTTSVVAGEGTCKVTATGMRTQVGLIAKRLKGPDADAMVKPLNPLQRSVNVLGKYISFACFFVITTGAAISYFTGYQSIPPKCGPDDSLCLLSESLVRGLLMAVAIIPHGLPLVIMIMLRVGSVQMAARNAVVTKQSAVDYLGATQVICTDKTGTLTEGRMAAKEVVSIVRGTSTPGGLTELTFYPQKGLDPQGGIFLSGSLTDEHKEKLDAGSSAKDAGLNDLGDPESEDASSPGALLAKAATAAVFLNCHATRIRQDENGVWQGDGNMSEAALKVAARKGRLEEEAARGQALAAAIPREATLEVPFSSSRKMSATIHTFSEAGMGLPGLRFKEDVVAIALVKGAPDKVMPSLGATLVLGKSSSLEIAEEPITKEERDSVEAQNGALAKQALRSLLLAVRPLTASDMASLKATEGAQDRLNALLAPGPLAFLALWGIFDPPRSTVPPSIKMAHEAGIKVVMITGDQRPTALAIGKLIGLLDPNATDEMADIKAKACKELHATPASPPRTTPGVGPKLERKRTSSVHDSKGEKDAHESEYKDVEVIDGMVHECVIWSRAQPTDKVCIVDSFRNQGHITAMTGDGVNDAPAIKHADIGVAMGISGTMVTKTAAEMILMDDNFTTIVSAVREGRKIYGNVQKYIIFNFSVKASECCCFLSAIIFGLPMPMKGLQQLVNLFVTHIIPPMSLAWEEVEEYTMRIPPRDTKHDLVVTKLLMLFRWFPFVIGYAVIIMSIFAFSLYQETGYLQSSALVGSSRRYAFEEKRSACRVAGHLDDEKNFIEDAEPFHCDCPGYAGGPKEDQWGRMDSSDYPINPWNGDIGDAFDKENTPFAGDGEDKLIKWCTDKNGVQRNCWRDPEGPRPMLDSSTNCATYGARNSQSVAYVMMHLGEVLFLATCRRDGHLFSPPVFSKAYATVLVFNLTVLVCLVYVPPITAFFGLLPLTPVRLMLALLGPFLIVCWNELVKVEYRRQLHLQHGDAMYAPAEAAEEKKEA